VLQSRPLSDPDLLVQDMPSSWVPFATRGHKLIKACAGDSTDPCLPSSRYRRQGGRLRWRQGSCRKRNKCQHTHVAQARDTSHQSGAVSSPSPISLRTPTFIRRSSGTVIWK
jgi:hypothetical protein